MCFCCIATFIDDDGGGVNDNDGSGDDGDDDGDMIDCRCGHGVGDGSGNARDGDDQTIVMTEIVMVVIMMADSGHDSAGED